MKVRRPVKILLVALLAIGLCLGGYLFYDRGRPAPIPMKETLYKGIVYRRLVQVIPHPMIAHVIVIDRSTASVGFLVTPPDSDGSTPLNARTTSQFLDEFDVQIAINGDGFTPWWSRSPADYYPHVGDPVTPLGFTASHGDVYTNGIETSVGVKPTLYFNRQNYPTFNNGPNKIQNAISGDRMIVLQGKPARDLDDIESDPRTAIGTNRNGRYVYLVVVDGRQPFYSEGATFVELAELLIKQGAYFAMALDGGGSSTMVIEGKNGKPVVLNSPIDNYIPGRERPVANHFGVYVNP
jgi:hypothetical protein